MIQAIIFTLGLSAKVLTKFLNKRIFSIICILEAMRPLMVTTVACVLLIVDGDNVKCYAQYMHVASEGCSTRAGVFAYLIVNQNVDTICVASCSSNTIQMLFTKTLPNGGITPPICVSNAIVTVGFDGEVTKYALDGKRIFSSKMVSEDEVSALSGRWDDGTIYMTAMRYEGLGSNRKPRYRCLWIDVQSNSPVPKGEALINPPLKLLRVEESMVIYGQNGTQQIVTPKK